MRGHAEKRVPIGHLWASNFSSTGRLKARNGEKKKQHKMKIGPWAPVGKQNCSKIPALRESKWASPRRYLGFFPIKPLWSDDIIPNHFETGTGAY
jgi:hypothetical protein